MAMPSFTSQDIADALRKYNIDPAQFSGKGQGMFSDIDIGKFFSGTGAASAGETPSIGGGMPAPELGGEGDLELPPMSSTPPTDPLKGDVGPEFQGMPMMDEQPRDPYAERDRQIEMMQRGELGGRDPKPIERELDDRYRSAPLPALRDVEGGDFKTDDATIKMREALDRINRLGGSAPGQQGGAGATQNFDQLAPLPRRRRY